MSAMQNAQSVAVWAVAMNLIEPSIVHGITATSAGFPQSVAETLMRRQVQFIGSDESENRILVFTKKRISAKEKKDLPAIFNGSDIEYRQSTLPSIGGALAVAHASPPYTIRALPSGSKHYACGSSISLGNSLETGTLGALVRDATGVLHGLSNNHVCGGCNNADVLMPILAPGISDVAAQSLDPFTIGHHKKVLTMSVGSPQIVSATDNFDAAIFAIKNPADVSSFQGDKYDTPVATDHLTTGLEVQKVGRTTGHTTGKVLCQITGSYGIAYQIGRYGFAGVVHYDPLFVVEGIGTEFSTWGDSGSLVVALDALSGAYRAVGIVVGGGTDPTGTSTQKTVSIVAPITPILAKLGVSLVATHNV